MLFSKKIFLGILIIGLAFSSANAQKNNKKATDAPVPEPVTAPLSPIVVQVFSGDTLELMSGEKLRLMGIDAPVVASGNQPGQEPWASDARKLLETLTFAKEVTIKSFGLKTDEYGRRIGLVYVGDTWLDYELVKAGLAIVRANRYIDIQSKQLLLEAQQDARLFGRGIWNTENPLDQPPRDFRAANNISEGDDSKADDWKHIIPKNSTKNSSSGGYTRSSKTSEPSSDNRTNNLSGDLALVGQVIEELQKVETKVSQGVRGGDLARQISSVETQFKEVPKDNSRELYQDVKDTIDAYKLAAEALKRREVAADADRDKYTKYIDQALEIGEKSLRSAERHLEQYNKVKR